MIEWIFFDLGSTLLDETDRVNERISATAKSLQVDKTEFNEQLERIMRISPESLAARRWRDIKTLSA